jgi:hypothetical protein
MNSLIYYQIHKRKNGISAYTIQAAPARFPLPPGRPQFTKPSKQFTEMRHKIMYTGPSQQQMEASTEAEQQCFCTN